MTNCILTANSAPYAGGAIFNYGGTLTVTNSTISGNSATDGGGIYNDQGPYNNYGATLTVSNSTISNNSVTASTYGAAEAGGILNHATLIATNSTISGNNAPSGGGGIYNNGTGTVTHTAISTNTVGNPGGGIYNDTSGNLTVIDSTISGNTSGSSGPGIGGGIFNLAAMKLVNSTISGNSASASGAGIFNNNVNQSPPATLAVLNSTIFGNTAKGGGGGIYNCSPGTLSMTNGTISGNTAVNNGGGVYNDTTSTSCTTSATTPVNLQGTIIALNTAGGDCFGVGAVSIPTFNADGDNSCNLSAANGDLLGASLTLNLATGLASNGGIYTSGATPLVNQTVALGAGSPAIDFIPTAFCSSKLGNALSSLTPAQALTDERGIARPQGPGCDIGAYEAPAAPPTGCTAVAWWKGNGNVKDYFGVNDGVAQGTPFQYAPGKVGQAFDFLGNPAAQSAVNIFKHPNLNMLTSDFTIAAWVNIPVGTQFLTDPGIIFDDYASPATYRLLINNDPSHFQVPALMFRDTGGNTVIAEGAAPINDGKWHYLAGVRKGTAGYIYVDGVQQASATNSSVGSIDTSGQVYDRIGGSNYNQNDPQANRAWFTGLIDEVQIYNCAEMPDVQTTVLATSPLLAGGKAQDSATVTGLVPNMAAAVAFTFFQNGSCTGPGTPAAGTKTSNTGTGTSITVNSNQMLSLPAGTDSFQALYEGPPEARGPCEPVTVSPATPTISTQASASATAGTAGVYLYDVATLSGGYTTYTGAMTFRLYGPSTTPTCSGTPVFGPVTSMVAGNSASSGNVTALLLAPGTYWWVVNYSLDPNNTDVVSACKDEPVGVVAVSTSFLSGGYIAGSASNSVQDTATVTGLTPAITKATVAFDFYDNTAHTDGDCTPPGQLIGGTTTVANNTASSTSNLVGPLAAGTVPAGTYSFKALYVDAPGAIGPCETVTVSKAAPTISTQASPGGVAGASTPAVVDSARLGGGYHPYTGTITYTLYGPNDPNCTGPIATTSTILVNAFGTAVAGAAPNSLLPGTYSWIASYSGDANNLPVAGACGDATESMTETPPTITTTASGNVTGVPAGQAIHDDAIVSGTPPFLGTVTFALYGPNDPTCSGPAVFTSKPTTVDQNTGKAASGSFTPVLPGTYYWIATFNNLVSNSTVAGKCGDVNESVTVNPTDGCDLTIIKTVTTPAPPLPIYHNSQIQFTLRIVNVGTRPCPDTGQVTPVVASTLVTDGPPHPNLSMPTLTQTLTVPFGAWGGTGDEQDITVTGVAIGASGTSFTNCATVHNAADTHAGNDKGCVTVQIQ